MKCSRAQRAVAGGVGRQVSRLGCLRQVGSVDLILCARREPVPGAGMGGRHLAARLGRARLQETPNEETPNEDGARKDRLSFRAPSSFLSPSPVLVPLSFFPLSFPSFFPFFFPSL